MIDWISILAGGICLICFIMIVIISNKNHINKLKKELK